MGKRGPLHQRGLKRRKGRQDAIDAATTQGTVEADFESPFEPDDDWHPEALALYEAAEKSGQAEWYAESDWAKLYMLCDQLSQNLRPQFVGFAKQSRVVEVNGEDRLVQEDIPIAGVRPMNGATINALQALMASLGISEGDRRRMGIELQRKKDGEGNEAERQAREDAKMLEDMQSGNVIPIDRASGGA